MKKLIVSCFALIFVFCGCLYGCKDNATDDMLLLSGRPEGEKLTGIVIPEADDTEGHIALAYELYSNANKLDQQCAKRIATSYCPVKTTMKVLGVDIDVQVDAYVYDIKNDNEYFLLEYQVAMSGLGALASKFSNDMVYGRASYCTLDMDEIVVHYVDNATIEDGKPTADWSNPEILSDTKPYFNATQDLLYEKTDIIISPDTITSATVSYDEVECIYNIEMELDVNNPLTTSKTIENLQAGAGDAAVYTSITEQIQIWDNGYYKHFLSTDKWESGSLSAELPYETAYSYLEADCNIHSYEEVEGIIQRLNEQQ